MPPEEKIDFSKIIGGEKIDFSKITPEEEPKKITEEEDDDPNVFLSALAGIGSGVIKIPTGFVSLGAELVDLGFGTEYAAELDEYFDKLNPFDELAEQTLAGKITEGITQFVIPGIGGYKLGAGATKALLANASTIGTKVAKGALQAKKAGKALDKSKYKKVAPKSKRIVEEKSTRNKLGLKEKALVGAGGITGSALGEAAVYDQDLDTILGDVLGFDPLKTDDELKSDERLEASRRLLNRARFGIESGLIGAAAGSIVSGFSKAAKIGSKARFEGDFIDRIFGRIRNSLTPEGNVGKEFFPRLREADDTISAAGEIAVNEASKLQDVAMEIASGAKLTNIFGKIKDQKQFGKFQELLQRRLENFGSAKKADNGVDYNYGATDTSKKAKDDLFKFLKNDLKADAKTIQRLDDSLYGARNQIDVFSDRVNELAETIMKEADSTVRPVIKDDPGVLKLLENLTKQNLGTKAGKKQYDLALKGLKKHLTDVNRKDLIPLLDNFTDAKRIRTAATSNIGQYLNLDYKIFKTSKGGLFASGMAKYKPSDEAYIKADNFFFGKLYNKYAATITPAIEKTVRKTMPELNAKQTKAEIAKRVKDTINRDPKKIEELSDKASELTAFLVERSGKGLDEVNEAFKNVPKELESLGLSIDQGVLKQRKLPDELKDLFGEIRDPFYNVANTLSKQAQFIAKYDAFDGLFKASKNKAGKSEIFFDADELPSVAAKMNVSKQAFKQIETSGPLKTALDGKFTFAEVADTLNGQSEQLTGLLNNNLYKWAVLYPKSISNQSKTIFNPFTHVRNFISAIAFTTMNGNILFQNPANTYRIFKEALKDGFNSGSEEAVKRKIKHQRLGIYGTNPIAAETEALAKATGTDLADGKFNQAIDTMGLGLVNKVLRFGRKMYVAEDNVFKRVNFESETGSMMKNLQNRGLTKENFKQKIQTDKKLVKDLERLIGRKIGTETNPLDDPLFRKNLYKPGGARAYKELAYSSNVADRELFETFTENMAANITKNNIPNYEYVGSLIKKLRNYPLGTFVSFPAEIIRTGINTVQRGAREALTPGFRATGLRRLAGTATTGVVFPAGIIELQKSRYDVSEDEIRALRRIVPSWSENGLLMPAGRDKDGTLKYSDISYIYPYDTLVRPATTLFNEISKGEATGESVNASLVQAGVKSMSEIMKPFISEAIFVEAANDIIFRGGLTREGYRVFNPEDDAGDIAVDIGMHLLDTLTPLGVPQATRLVRSATKREDKHGRVYDLEDEVKGIFGFRAIDSDPKRAAPFIILDFQKKERNAKNLFTSSVLKGGRVDPASIVDAYIKSERARFENFKNLKEDVDALRELGLSDAEISKQLGRLPKNIRGAIYSGKFIPNLPTKGTYTLAVDKAKDLSEELGAEVSASIFEALPYIREIYKQNMQKSMTDDFDEGITLPEELFKKQDIKKEPVTPKIDFNQLFSDTGPGSVVTGQGPTIQGQGSTIGQQDVRFRKGTLTDPTERLIAGVD